MLPTVPICEFDISPELDGYLEPADELSDKLLEEEIVNSGGPARPLVVWREGGFLIDGHRRYRICQKHKLGYKIEQLSFDSIEDVKTWMLKNQVGPRNLSDLARARAIAILFKEVAEMPDEEREKRRAEGKPSQTRDIVAEMTNESSRTVSRAVAATAAMEAMIPEWQLLFSSERGVFPKIKIPQRFLESIASLPPHSQFTLLNDVLTSNDIEPLLKAFPEKRLCSTSGPSMKAIRDAAKAREESYVASLKLPPSIPSAIPKVVPDTLPLIDVIEACMAAVGHAAKLCDALWSDPYLAASSSYNKKRVDQSIREIGIVLQDVKKGVK